MSDGVPITAGELPVPRAKSTTRRRTERAAKRARRGRGEGGLYERADGQWCACVTIGYDEDGRRRRRVLYGPTKGDVLEKLDGFRAALANGMLLEPTQLTVARFLNQWLTDTARPAIRPATHRLYDGMIRNHINPHIGGVRLDRLTPLHVQSMYAAMERAGCSGRLRQLVHAVLHKALGQALKWGLVVRNVCDAVEKPRAARRTMQVLTPEQVGTLIKKAEGDRLGALYVLAIASGLRQGELLGLQWEDIDLEGQAITVRHQLSEDAGKFDLTEPKTDKGRRRVDLPMFAVTSLRNHGTRMEAEEADNIEKARNDTKRITPPALVASQPFVFCDTDAKPIRKSNLLRRSFHPFLKAAKLPKIRFHDLRHTAATLLLAQGVHPKIVQERLGHAQISLTLDTYSHVLPSMQKNAVARLDRLIVATLKKSAPNL